MDESLLLQDPEMVCRYAVLKANGISHIGEGGSRMVTDSLVDQKSDLPLEDFLPGKARMLDRRENRRRCDEDRSAHFGYRDPGERMRARAAQADGERRALPSPHG